MPTGRPRPYSRLTLALGLVGLVCAPATAYASPFRRDRTPLPAAVTGAHTHAAPQLAGVGGGGGSAALHMLLGLAIVLALIFVLYKVLRRVAGKNDSAVRGDGWMAIVSSTPLAPSRSLHLVRVGDELVLVGASEQSVTPIRVYSPEETRRLGVDPDDGSTLFLDEAPAVRPSFGSALLETLRKKTAR